MKLSAFSRVVRLFTPQEKRQSLGLLVLITVMAVFDTIGVAGVLPFLSVMANPGLIETSAPLAWLHAALGAPETTTFLLWLGFGAIGLLLLGGVMRTLTEFAINHFIYMRAHAFSARLLEIYLRQPYEFHLTRHTGELQKTILSEVSRVVGSMLWPGLMMLANGAVLVAIAVLLFLVEPRVALGVAVVLGLSYGLIYLAVRRRVHAVGEASVTSDRNRFEAAGEALSGIKDIRLRGVEGFYLERFTRPSERLARAHALANTLSFVPRYVIEAVAFCGLIGVAMAVMVTRGGAGSAAMAGILPLIGLYVVAGMRMLPAVQAVYRGATMISFSDAALESMARDLNDGARLPPPPTEAPVPLPLTRTLVLEGIGYRYPGASVAGLAGIDLTIPAGSTVGVVGRTGSGKTTLADVMLGLLPPSTGRLLVDGVQITPARSAAWQASVGYVPQEIFLLDAPISANIALGLPPERIDPERLARAARLARLEDVVAALPDGYATSVGERGVRLSGGQRQRIGIARALYNDPALMVFDEATSALDTATERELMEALASLAGTRTIVMIAHRLSTVRHCDIILVMDGGRLVGHGSYAELIDSSPHFRALAAA